MTLFWNNIASIRFLIYKLFFNLARIFRINDEQSLMLLYPFIMAIGICSYLYMDCAISLALSYIAVGIILNVYLVYLDLVVPVKYISILLIGFSCTMFYTTHHDKHSMYDNVQSEHHVLMHGKVDKIVYGNRSFIIFANIRSDNQYIDGKVRMLLQYNQRLFDVHVGDIVSFIGDIHPSKKIEWPRTRIQDLSYNVILGHGSIKRVKSIIHGGVTLKHIISKWQSYTINRITSGPKNYSVTAAMVTGTTRYMKIKDLENIRNTGLAHLLAISGLHMTIVAGSVFFVVRYLLAHTKLCLYYDTKFFAALIAIIIAIGYLSITTISISAVRSLIMFVIFMICIMLNRAVSTIDIWSIAAMAIMVNMPTQILLPSFQMSFIATLALIIMHRDIDVFFNVRSTQTLALKYPILIFNIFVSSFVAGLSIVPFEIYHFGRFSLLGPIANELAIPLVSFILMPISMIATFLMFCNIEWFALYIANATGTLLLSIAKYFSSIQWGVVLIRSMPDYIMLMHCSAIVMIMIRNIFWKICGIILIILAIILHYNTPKHNMIISADGSHIAMLIDSRYILATSLRKSHFIDRLWSSKLGVRKLIRDTSIYQDQYYCNGNGFADSVWCKYYSNSGHSVYIAIQKPKDWQNVCNHNVVINLTNQESECKFKTISLENLRLLGRIL